jgi:DNA-directed RNA polymerase specialized sigma24 family protein
LRLPGGGAGCNAFLTSPCASAGATGIDPRLRREFGLSDVVQVTLVEAWRDVERLLALDAKGRRRWLRRMLVNNSPDAIEKARAVGRDYRLKLPGEP